MVFLIDALRHCTATAHSTKENGSCPSGAWWHKVRTIVLRYTLFPALGSSLRLACVSAYRRGFVLLRVTTIKA
jgi:hypothetical protein